MPSPAAYPSVLACDGAHFTDANSYVMPQLRGFCVQPFTKFTAGDYTTMYDFGCRLIRLVIYWNLLEPTGPNASWTTDPSSPPGISASFVATLDQQIQWAVAAGLYVYICFDQSTSVTMPTWAQVTAPQSSLQNFVQYGENWITYIAARYGDLSDPIGAGQYTAAVIGGGLNEPVSDWTSGSYPDDLLTAAIGSGAGGAYSGGLVVQEAQGAAWARAYAPQWIWGIMGVGTSSALVPNAAGSGQTGQTFTGLTQAIMESLIPGGNYLVETHDNLRCFTDSETSAPWYGTLTTDGRAPTSGVAGGNLIATDDSSYLGYPPSPAAGGAEIATREMCQGNMAVHLAADAAAASALNCPLYISEGNFHFPNMTYGCYEYAIDKISAYCSAGSAGGSVRAPAAITEWEYDYNPANTDCCRPQVGTTFGVESIVAAGYDGWTSYAMALMNQLPWRELDSGGTRYRARPA